MSNKIEILTPSGFQPFDGVFRKYAQTIKIVLSDNSSIRCTLDHKFFYKNNWIIAGSLKPNIKITQKLSVVSIAMDTIDYVYDPVNVSNGNQYFSNNIVSHNCDWLGSSNSLLSGDTLRSLSRGIPKSLLPDNTLLQYQEPIKEHSYILLADTARGKGLDYSTFHIIDISVMPYKIVCTYRNNQISTLVFPEVIFRIGSMYNNAFVLIETNDLGQQVADILFYDLEYENVYMSVKDDIKEGGSGRSSSPGLYTSKRTKAIGCDMLKSLVEGDKLEINDAETIGEFTTFIRVGNTYKAEEGKHDDLIMPLVMFGYLTTQPVFKDLFDFSLREKFFAKQLQELEDQMMPLGWVSDDVDTNVQYHDGWVEASDDSFRF
jgi:hypothetical protein